MNATNVQQMNQPVAVIRPGLLDRLKGNSGIRNDEAFARLIGVSRATLQRFKNGDEVSMRAAVGISLAFGLGIGEIVEVRQVEGDPSSRSDVGAAS
ncbi:helix-turn-helix domain-containing protein [Lysinibacter cavernae]|uniref:Transcriptional regulator with XRE-family HTH domain n=1 Tax=Lysinibacter cavernae TaxID=1640652 RepID=A0A7X5QZ31_9MICO|nr:helix-turn-helix transcriptional regulator [Lysinibacter cavernae]NIH52512.1 transcriptional regulator with XRE-family HTH domain [Lysinibacter cavernae]